MITSEHTVAKQLIVLSRSGGVVFEDIRIRVQWDETNSASIDPSDPSKLISTVRGVATITSSSSCGVNVRKEKR